MEMVIKMFIAILTLMLDRLITPEMLQKHGDKIFDFIENAVADSETKIDDMAVLPIIKFFRVKFNIPDND